MIIVSLALATTALQTPAKATFSSDRTVAELAMCVAEKLTYLAPPSVLPEVAGRTKVIFTSMGKVWAEVTIVAGAPNQLELRGVAGKRVRNNIQRCL